MTVSQLLPGLLSTIDAYFELMFDAEVCNFERVFAPTAQLHGLKGGALRVLKAAEYREMLSANPSPKSKQAPRLQEILLVDLASPEQALVKVRVRIDTIVYVDYLSLHLLPEGWRVTAKSFHVEAIFPVAA